MAKRILKYRSGDTIIEQGKIEKRMYIILDGEVEISIQEKVKSVKLATLKKNDFFGEISLFNETPRSAYAKAVGNVKLTYIDSIEELEEFLQKNNKYAIRMVKMITIRLANTDEILKSELSGSAKAAILQYRW